MTTVVLPLRGVPGMSRLAGVLDPPARSRLTLELADRLVDAAAEAGLEVIVVTASLEVRAWAAGRGLAVVDDPGGGLDAAATAGTAAVAGRWALVHGDLPLVDARDLLALTDGDDLPVLAPSKDGGTSAVVDRGAFPFAYGPGSFARHLARVPHARVVVRPGLAVDLDRPHDLAALR